MRNMEKVNLLESGIVEIKINDHNGAETTIESEIGQGFDLKKVVVIPFQNQTENV